MAFIIKLQNDEDVLCVYAAQKIENSGSQSSYAITNETARAKRNRRGTVLGIIEHNCEDGAEVLTQKIMEFVVKQKNGQKVV
jgi:hypothetical protein